MRIRRNASRLLGSASCQPWLYFPPAPCSVDPPPPPAFLCHLNRSPWDVSPSPSEEPPSPDPPFLKFDGVILGRTHPLLEAAAAEATATATTTAAAAAQKRDHKINGKKQRRHAKALMANDDDDVVVKPMKMKQCRKRCNKSDGKGWHCKKPAQVPHSLCRYHLAQLRAYNAAYRVPVKGRRRTDGDTGRSDFYYYSGFGPWRAKRRNGSSFELDVAKKESVHEVDEGDDNDDHGVYDDNNDDDDDEEVGVGVSRGKRGRKRIKARSLKSLL